MSAQKFGSVVTTIALLIAIVAILVGIWWAQRWTNQALYYGDSTQKTVCSMVRAEHLTDSGREICKK